MGEFDHLVIASTLAGLHAAWHPPPRGVERSGLRGPLGRLVAALSERLRRAVDLEHWAAFNRRSSGFATGCGVSDGESRQLAPATIVLLGGDVHNSLRQRGRAGRRQPFPGLPDRLLAVPEPTVARERGSSASPGPRSGAALLVARTARRRAVPFGGVEVRPAPTFDNSIGELELDGRAARVTLWRSPQRGRGPRAARRRSTASSSRAECFAPYLERRLCRCPRYEHPQPPPAGP